MTLQLRNSGGVGYYSHATRTFPSKRFATYSPTKPDFSAEFYRELRRWRFETSFVSSIDKIVDHESFKEIVSMGPRVVPLIISEIKSRPDALMVALPLITGADPVQARNRGNMAEMASDWIDWYQRNS